MTTVVISGANRGLGLEFAKQYASGGARVFVGARDPSAAKELNAAAVGSKDLLSVFPLDVADDASVRTFCESVGETPVDILIANAGVFGGDTQHTLGDLDFDSFAHTFSVNALGPLRLAQGLRGNLKAAKGRFIAITSGMGSIEDASGGYLSYRSSKAALNMAMRALAQDLKQDRIICVPLSPGWAKTDMGGPSAPQETGETVREMRRRIGAYTLKDSGKFLNWDGREIAW